MAGIDRFSPVYISVHIADRPGSTGVQKYAVCKEFIDKDMEQNRDDAVADALIRAASRIRKGKK